MPEDSYSDPITGVLYNKLGLSTAAELEAAEREVTHVALILLDESPVSPTYDLPHLQEIHKRIFGDIYEWAGQIRTVAIAKGATFCLPQYIDSSATVIFRQLHDEDFLRGLRRDAFVGRLTHYLGDVNALHPFREGNGRAQRAFLGQLARDAGFTLAWQHLDPVRNVSDVGSPGRKKIDPPPVIRWADLWTELKRCGRAGWPQLFRLPAWLVRDGASYSHEQLVWTIRNSMAEISDAQQGGAVPLVTLEPDDNGNYSHDRTAADEPVERRATPAGQRAEDHRTVVFLDASEMVPEGKAERR